MSDRARAFRVRKPGAGEIREVPLPEPGPDEVVVRTLHSGISRGTETLVFRGEVPESQREAMRAPFQDGDFPGPVKYGYLAISVVERGPAELRGRTVSCLHPHQTAFVVPAHAVDRVSVVGAGMVGGCMARLLARFPGVEVELVDVDGSRADLATRLGVRFASPTAPREVATSSCTPARRPRGSSARSACSGQRGPFSSSAGTATGR